MINLCIPCYLEYSVHYDLLCTQWLFFHCTSWNFRGWYVFPEGPELVLFVLYYSVFFSIRPLELSSFGIIAFKLIRTWTSQFFTGTIWSTIMEYDLHTTWYSRSEKHGWHQKSSRNKCFPSKICIFDSIFGFRMKFYNRKSVLNHMNMNFEKWPKSQFTSLKW